MVDLGPSYQVIWHPDADLERAAAKLGMTQPQIARIEAGEHNPTIDTLARIAQALDIEFAIDVNPRRREPRLVNKRARTHDAIASYTTGDATVLLAAG